MADIHGIGIFQPDGDPLTGAFAAWQNPAQYTTTDWQTGGFTLCALWMRVFSESGVRSWVEVGYTQGFGGGNHNVLYWAEGLAGSYYEYVVAAAGPVGTTHSYIVEHDGQKEWVVIVDGKSVGWSLQEPLGIEINVGGEMTSANNTLTPTFPMNMSYKDTADYVPWTTQPNAIGQAQDPPLQFTWEQKGVIGRVANEGIEATSFRPQIPASDWLKSRARLSPTERFERATAPGATGGPFLSDTAVDAVALRAARAAGDPNAKVLSLVRTVHGDAEQARGAGRSLGVRADREVVVARLSGDFVLHRRPRGEAARRGDRLTVEVDATDGSVLAWGLEGTQTPMLATRADDSGAQGAGQPAVPLTAPAEPSLTGSWMFSPVPAGWVVRSLRLFQTEDNLNGTLDVIQQGTFQKYDVQGNVVEGAVTLTFTPLLGGDPLSFSGKWDASTGDVPGALQGKSFTSLTLSLVPVHE